MTCIFITHAQYAYKKNTPVSDNTSCAFDKLKNIFFICSNKPLQIRMIYFKDPFLSKNTFALRVRRKIAATINNNTLITLREKYAVKTGFPELNAE